MQSTEDCLANIAEDVCKLEVTLWIIIRDEVDEIYVCTCAEHGQAVGKAWPDAVYITKEEFDVASVFWE